MKIPSTRSGRATIVEITDQEAYDLQVGDIVIVEAPVRHALEPRVVFTVRTGVAGEDGALEEVPVVDLVGTGAGAHRPQPYASCDVFRVDVAPAPFPPPGA